MNQSKRVIGRFFGVIGSQQAYLNIVYLLASFPLGIFYFVFLVSGLSIGISLLIVWVGIPILFVVGFGWLSFASFERFMAIHLLKEDIPAMVYPSSKNADIWTRVKENIVNPVLWKSPLFLFLKFPLGITTFVVLATMISLTLAFLTLPLTYESVEFIQPGIFFGMDLPIWHIDQMGDALLGSLIGLVLWPVTLHISNGLAWVHAKLGRLMLSINPIEGFSNFVKAPKLQT